MIFLREISSEITREIMARRRQDWGDIHRMFLQVMMSRRVLSAQEMRKVYAKLEPDESKYWDRHAGSNTRLLLSGFC